MNIRTLNGGEVSLINSESNDGNQVVQNSSIVQEYFLDDRLIEGGSDASETGVWVSRIRRMHLTFDDEQASGGASSAY